MVGGVSNEGEWIERAIGCLFGWKVISGSPLVDREQKSMGSRQQVVDNMYPVTGSW